VTDVRTEEKSLKVGEALSVQFTEAASAGYLWSATEATGSLQISKSRKTMGHGVGGFGTVEFTAVADVPGTYEIEFVHKRPWNDEVAEAVLYRLHVNP
jgi:predicted secreted protein